MYQGSQQNQQYGQQTQQNQGQNQQYGYQSQQNQNQGQYGQNQSYQQQGQQSQYGNQSQQQQGQQQYSNQNVQQFNQNQVQYQSHDVISETFYSIDTNRSGKLNEDQLREALSAICKFKFSSNAANSVMKMFDKDRTGKLNLDEFKGIYQYVTQLHHVFTQYDKDNSGTLDQQEVYSALITYGFGLDSQSFVAVYNSVDTEKSGKLTFDEYVQLCLFLGTAKNIFMHLDSNRSGQITLNFNQWVNWTSYFN
jgi:Ca2+-binding EF-hand superfamily protein